MSTQPDAAIISPLRFLLFSGGFFLLAFGLVLTLWGLWNVLRPHSFVKILSQLALSVLPGMVAMVAIYLAAADFMELADSETAPKPAALATTVGPMFSYGFVGLLATIVPVLLGVVAIRKHYALRSTHSSDAVN